MGCSLSSTAVESAVPVPNRWSCAFDLRVAEYYDFKCGPTGACACDLHFLARTFKSTSTCWSAVPNLEWWDLRLACMVPLSDQEWVWAAMCGRTDAFLRESIYVDVRARWADIRQPHTNHSLYDLMMFYAWPTLIQLFIDLNPMCILDSKTTTTNLCTSPYEPSLDISEIVSWIDLQRETAKETVHQFFQRRSVLLRPHLSPHLNTVLAGIHDLVNIVYDYLNLSTYFSD